MRVDTPGHGETINAKLGFTYTLHDQIVGDVRGINERNGVDHVRFAGVSFFLSDDNSLTNGGFVGSLGVPNLLVKGQGFFGSHGVTRIRGGWGLDNTIY